MYKKSTRRKTTKLSRSFPLFILFVFVLSGCSATQVTQYNDTPQIASEEYYRDHPSGFDKSDLSHTSLTSTQKDVFVRYTEIEMGLSYSQLRTVAEFYEDFLGNEKMLSTFLGRSLPYLDYVQTVFEERDMPKDLPYLAFIESGYNVKISSRAGASGLWQFMPRTGKSFGLKQDWYGDWRHDPYLATQAAADYLEYLNGLFDDWLLAVSAYNAGEGKIGRALDETGAETLHELVERNNKLNDKMRIRQETLEYIPRFIAMKKIMVNADELGVEPNLEHTNDIYPEIHSALVNTNTDLLAISQEINMSWEDFHKYNPAIKSYISPSDRLVYVHVPIYKQDAFEAALSKEMDKHGWQKYTVRKNDTYKGLAKITGIPSNVLQQANSSKKLIAGREILIPKPIGKQLPSRITAEYTPPKPTTVANNTSSKPKTSTSSSSKKSSGVATSHKVKSGDTLYSIAKKYDVKLDDIYKLNKGLSAKSLKVGAVIKLPYEHKLTTYTVRSGDTLWSISRKNNTDTNTLMELNKLSSASRIKVGQKILIP